IDDISGGREEVAVRCVNDVDGERLRRFVYVTKYVAGPGIHLSNNPELAVCCDCEDSCRDPNSCACLRLHGGHAYNWRGQLMEECNTIYECGPGCGCSPSRCKNRVVGKGLRLRLEVFRCVDTARGWGVRA
ncbi:unnamed protein product, partial [Phaeothamnion confervicola]